jgi:hypothetical protein
MVSGGEIMAGLQVTAALAESALATVATPILADTQPWRWVVHPGALDLYADRAHHRDTVDAEGHRMLLSCGAALHHTRVALAAEGLAPHVTLLPDTDPDHLARVTAAEPPPLAGAVPKHYQHSHTGSITGNDSNVEPGRGDHAGAPARAVAAIVEAAAAEGVQAQVITRRQATTLAGSELGRTDPHHPGDRYAVLCGDTDSPEAWLRAGEALAAAWLAAARNGVSVNPHAPTSIGLAHSAAAVAYVVVHLVVQHSAASVPGATGGDVPVAR